MNKVILVIDTPESCEKCILNTDNNSRPDCCKVIWKPISYIGRREDCPLKSMPEKSLTGKSDYYQWGDWEDGWNACIDSLNGE